MDRRGLQIELHALLTRRLSDDDVRSVCFGLGIDYESVPGEGKNGKVRELITTAGRHQLTGDLLKLLNRLRPDIELEQFLPLTGQPTEATRPEAHAGTESAEGLQVLLSGRSIMVCGQTFVFVPGSFFPMGSDDGYPHERPRHRVSVTGCFMAETAVTNQAFAYFAGEADYVTTATLTGAGLTEQDGQWRSTPGADFRHPAGPSSTDRGQSRSPSRTGELARCAGVLCLVVAAARTALRTAERGTMGICRGWSAGTALGVR